MKSVLLILLTMGVCLIGPASVRALQQAAPAQVQACKTDEGIVVSIKQDLADTVTAVKKESLDDFQKDFHQQACMSKISICLQTVQDLLSCLDKAAHDPGPAANECKTKEAAYGKFKAALQQDLAELKAAKDSKTAKNDIEKFDFTH
jgi:hypothetical protein